MTTTSRFPAHCHSRTVSFSHGGNWLRSSPRPSPCLSAPSSPFSARKFGHDPPGVPPHHRRYTQLRGADGANHSLRRATMWRYESLAVLTPGITPGAGTYLDPAVYLNQLEDKGN